MRFDASYVTRIGERRRGAELGLCLIGCCSALILCTVWFLPTTDQGRTTALTLVGVAMVLALGLSRLPWEGLPVEGLLAFPGVGVIGMTIGALLNRGISPAYSGFFTLAIFYIAATQSRWVTIASIAAALPCWVVCEGGFSSTVAVKTPVSVGVWTLIGLSVVARRDRRVALIERLAHAASIDSLTGLASRRELPRILEIATGGDAVVLLDLDNFKSVNDELGHPAGDQILADLGGTIQAVLRDRDVAIRYGGDEVVMVLADVGPSGADALLQRLKMQWTKHNRPTFSAGVAVCGMVSGGEALQLADEALYRAKRQGRNSWAHAESNEAHLLRIVR